MLKLVGKLSSISRAFSTGRELRLDPHLRGVIVRNLPYEMPSADLQEHLKGAFNSSSIDLKKDAFGYPAYAIVRFDDEKGIEEALKLNKKPIAGRKAYICVSFYLDRK